MAQTGFTPIQLFSTSTAAAAPTAGSLTNSTLGSELAINITDGKLFYKDNLNAVQVIGWKTVPTTAGGTGLTSYTAGDLSYYASGTALTKLGIGTNGQILTSSGTAPQWSTLSGVAVTTFSAGTTGFTPSTATSGAITLAGTLIAVNGGTGQSSYTQGDLLYANSSTTLARLADVATGNALISGGVGGDPSYGKIGLTTHVSGTLPVANGGTNLTSYTANGVVYASGTGTLATNTGLTYDGTNLKLGTKTMPTVTGGRVQLINDCLIFSGDTFIGSPYTQNLRIDITWSGDFSSNRSLALVEVGIAAREWATTPGCAFGWLYAYTTSGTPAQFTQFVTTGITTFQGTLTASSGGNSVLRITFDPTNQTDIIGYSIRIPTMNGGTGFTVSSISATLV